LDISINIVLLVALLTGEDKHYCNEKHCQSLISIVLIASLNIKQIVSLNALCLPSAFKIRGNTIL